MGQRTGKKPTADDSFVWRICHALDIMPAELAYELGVTVEDVYAVLDLPLQDIAESEHDTVLWALSEYVAAKLGYLMAVKHQLDRKLQKERAVRVDRMARFRRFMHEES